MSGPLDLIFGQGLSEPEGTLEWMAPDSLMLQKKTEELRALLKLLSSSVVDEGSHLSPDCQPRPFDSPHHSLAKEVLSALSH